MTKTPYLAGHFLLAMPTIADPRFERTVVYMCMHSEEGAMGLVVNRLHQGLDFAQLLEQLDIDVPNVTRSVAIHQGGPVEIGRGFVLHSADYVQDSTMVVSETVAMTATVDILKEIAGGGGPARCRNPAQRLADGGGRRRDPVPHRRRSKMAACHGHAGR